MPGMDEEGWYRDPYGRHECRWFSAGTATELVRDGHQVGHDAPPPGPPSAPLVPCDEAEAENEGDDLRRADALQDDGPFDGRKTRWKAARVVLNPGDADVW
jgi:hypothetical protein